MIGVIVLNWNNPADTIECLHSVQSSQKVAFRVYLVDNGSTDGSVDLILKEHPKIVLIQNAKNEGFSGGNNRGIQRALFDGVTHIFILNNDAIVLQDTLFLLLEQSNKNPKAILGPKIYYYDSPAVIWYAGGGWSFDTASFFHRGWNLRDAEIPEIFEDSTEYVCGCALFTRADIFQEVGLFDERFFLNWEDVDWSFRAREKGFECLYASNVKIWHKVSASFPGGKRGAVWQYHYTKGRLLWMKKHLPRNKRRELFREIVWPQIQQQMFHILHSPIARAICSAVIAYFIESSVSSFLGNKKRGKVQSNAPNKKRNEGPV